MSGFTPQVKAILSKAGCCFVRRGRGDHEIWESPINGKRFTVDGDIRSRHTANGTLKDAGLPKQF
ncbi:MAG: type II toxin-antitoxin system HicA family toxin [Caulobacteraceae bacterium]